MSKFIKVIFCLVTLVSFGLMATSCSSDEEITDADANTELVQEATNYLNGEIVLSTKARMNGVDKTLLPGGCPTKFKFEWSKTDGSVWGTDTDGSPSSAKGSSVQGYYNAKTHQIQFIVEYNMMNVRSDCFLQTIDKSRLATFDEDKAKYEEDLKAYKKEHGIKRDCSLYI